MARNNPKFQPGDMGPGQDVGLLNQQLEEARQLREAQYADVDRLRSQLAAGTINQKQYYEGVDALWDAQMQQLRGDFQEQGRPEDAKAVRQAIAADEANPAESSPGLEDELLDRPTEEDTSRPDDVQFDDGSKPEPAFRAQTDEDDFLFGSGPVPQAQGGYRVPAKAPPPPEVDDYIAALVEMAKDPSAPYQVFKLLRLFNQQVNGA